MKANICKLAQAMLLGSLLVTAAIAEDAKTNAPDSTTGEAELVVQGISGRRESAKFEEYRAIRPVTGNVAVSHEDGPRFYLDFAGRHIGLEDQRYNLDAGRYGTWALSLEYDETPHRFFYGARTAYQGVGTGNLTLTPALQAAFAGAAAPNGATRLALWTANSVPYDLELFRKRITAEARYHRNESTTFRAAVLHENREGTRPFSFSAGPAEVPEPIDYETTNGLVEAECAKENWLLAADLTVSDFDNKIGDLTLLSAVTVLGAAANGLNRVDLYPSNTARNFGVTGSVSDLPWHGRITARASGGHMDQNDPFIPFTANTRAANAAAANNSIVGRGVAQSAQTAFFNFNYTAHPTERSGIRAYYNHYDRESESGATLLGFEADADGNPVVGNVTYQPFSFDRRVAGIDLSHDVGDRAVATVGWKNTKTHRDDREVSTNTENGVRLSVDSRACRKLDLHGSYEHSVRGSNFYGDGIPYGDLIFVLGNNPYNNRFDLSERRRNQGKLVATGYVGNDLTISGSATLVDDEYPDAFFGVLSDETRSAGVEVEWAASKKVHVNGFYNKDRIEGSMREREWARNGGPTDFTRSAVLESASNWQLDDITDVDTYGASVLVTFKPKVDDFLASYSNAHSDGRMVFTSAIDANTQVATTARDLNQFAPLPFNNVDDNRLQTFQVRYNRNVADHWAFGVGYLHERLTISDYALDGITLIPINRVTGASQAITMASRPIGYSADVTFGSVKYRF